MISKHRKTKIKKAISRKRKKPLKKEKPIQVPETVVIEYSKRLLKENRRFKAIVRKELFPHLKEIGELTRFDAIDTIGLSALILKMKQKFFKERILPGHEPKMMNYVNTIKNTIVRPMIKRTEQHHQKSFESNHNKILAVDPIKKEDWLKHEMELAVKANVDLIKTIPQENFQKIEQMVTHAARAGRAVGSLQKDIIGHFEAGENQARLIARDQIAKFNGSLTKNRSQKNGIKRYIWHTVKDQRVRDKDNSSGTTDHRSLEGQIFNWDKPPVTVFKGKRAGERHHPGMDIQCRCYAENIWQDVLDEPVEEEVAQEEKPKTRADAEKKLLDTGLKHADLGRMEDSHAVAVEEQYSKLSQKYNNNNFIEIKSSPIENNLRGRVKREWDEIESRMILSTTTTEETVKEVKELADKGFSAKIDADKYEQYVITHEFAHSMFSSKHYTAFPDLYTDQHKQFKNRLGQIHEGYKNEVKRAVKKFEDGNITKEQKNDAIREIKISDYSQKNIEEWMAEGFAEFELSKTPSKYSGRIGNLIKEFWGKQ